jgi:hypothetical protein
MNTGAISKNGEQSRLRTASETKSRHAVKRDG